MNPLDHLEMIATCFEHVPICVDKKFHLCYAHNTFFLHPVSDKTPIEVSLGIFTRDQMASGLISREWDQIARKVRYLVGKGLIK